MFNEHIIYEELDYWTCHFPKFKRPYSYGKLFDEKKCFNYLYKEIYTITSCIRYGTCSF